MHVYFLRGGTRIASGSDDANVRIWDAHTGLYIHTYIRTYIQYLYACVTGNALQEVAMMQTSEYGMRIQVCILTYIHACKHQSMGCAYRFVYLHTYMHANIRVWDVHTGCIYTHTHTYIYIHTHARKYTHAGHLQLILGLDHVTTTIHKHTDIPIYICVCVFWFVCFLCFIYIYLYIYIYIYIYIHTHTHRPASAHTWRPPGRTHDACTSTTTIHKHVHIHIHTYT